MTANVMVPSAITRSADHRYTYEGVTYPSVTTILGMLDKSGPLMGWAARETATAALAMVKLGTVTTLDGVTHEDPDGPLDFSALETAIRAVGRPGVIKMLSSRSTWQRDEAAQLGTEVHALADLVVRGEPTPSMTDTQRARVLHYAKWWKDSGWTLRLSEAMVVRPDTQAASIGTLDGQIHTLPAQVGWGGTFDLLAKDADGRTVLADVKTGKAVYREAVLQLAAYGMASKVQPAGDHKAYTMPVPDRYVILHVTADGVREVEVAVGTAERMAFLACLDLYHWSESMKGKKL